ncbi:MAG: TRAP transporter substrate-binding protein DctP [Clostridiales Family XIII bacterium]|jgi:TRAP-type C4-dicarboxylate transport system substrate-binding protein|nr:TRAP transporter substrate-binding protein DctP [Clostridiales Family XIII bacterium]
MERRLRFLPVLLLVLALILGTVACGGTASNSGSEADADASAESETTGDTEGASAFADLEPVHLTFTMHDPVTSRIGQATQAWIDEVAALTDNKLTIELFGSGTLAPGPEALNFVMDGTADIGWLYTMFYPGQFSLTEVVALPMNGPTHPAQTAQVLWDLYDATPELQTELSKVHVLLMYGNPVNFISTKKGPINTLADIRGLKLRCPAGAMTEVMKLWGAAPEVVPPGDTYDQLSKDVIGGTSWEWQGLEAFKLYEQLDYYMEGMPIYEGVFVVGMNNEKWAALDPAYQQVLSDTTGKAGSVTFGETFYNAAQESKAAILEADSTAEIVTPTDEAIAEFKTIADGYVPIWVSENTKDGFDAQAYVEKAAELTEQYKR